MHCLPTCAVSQTTTLFREMPIAYLPQNRTETWVTMNRCQDRPTDPLYLGL